MTTALVLSGGGSLGAVQAGMLVALDEAGVVPDLLVGTSVGALNAAFVARRGWPGATEGLAEIWTGIRRSDVFPLSLRRVLRAARGRHDHAVPVSGLARLLATHLPYGDIEDAAVRLAVVATDVMTGREVVLTSGPVADAVLASAALPGVFPPVVVDGRPLIDGGLVNHTPVTVAARLGAHRIYVLPTGYACALPAAPGSALGMALHAFSLAVHQRLALDVVSLGSTVELLVAPPLCPLRVGPSDFSQAAELIERSRAATAAWLVQSPRGEPGADLGLHEHRRRAG
jgi:NTE family protein